MIRDIRKTGVFILILTFFLTSNLFAQRSALKSLFETEAHVISQTTRNLTNESKTILKGITSKKNLIKEHQNKLRKFWNENKESIHEIAEHIGEEVITNTIESTANESFYLYQIFHNNYYPSLYKALCKKLKVSEINTSDMLCLFIGQKVNNYTISPQKLYRLHFLFSDQFAKVELEKMMEKIDCSSKQAADIIKLAKTRKIEINKQSCVNSKVEKDAGDPLWGMVLLAALVYLSFRIYKRLTRNKLIEK